MGRSVNLLPFNRVRSEVKKHKVFVRLCLRGLREDQKSDVLIPILVFISIPIRVQRNKIYVRTESHFSVS